MKQNLLCISLTLIAYSVLYAQTPIYTGTINGQTWTVAGSPYIIKGDITVEYLNIQPGVIVEFEDDYKFEINNYLVAKGVYSDSIIFRPDSSNSVGWKGLKFKNGSSAASEIAYCRIEGANGQGLWIEEAIQRVANCRIVYNNGDGIHIRDNYIDMKAIYSSFNTLNGIKLETAQVSLTNSVIYGNNGSGIISTNNSDSTSLINTVIAGNIGNGYSGGYGKLRIINSIIFDNSWGILSTVLNPDISYSNIQDTTFYPNPGNINADPEFTNDEFFTLAESSPCIDSGDPSGIFNDLFSPPSQGESRNDMGIYGGPYANLWYPPLFFNRDSISFGKVTIDSALTVSLNVKNYRNNGLTVENVFFDGVNSQVFLTDKQFFYLPFLGELDLQISFMPNQERSYLANLILETAAHGSVALPISGEGVIARLNLLQTVLNFGDVSLNDSSILDLPIQNLGSDTLRIQVLNPSTSTFSIDRESLKIPANIQFDTLFVKFKPDSMVLSQDSLIILSNDPQNPRKKVTLSGRGLAPLLKIDRSSLDFGSVPLSSDSALDLSLSNLGNDTLFIDTLFISQQDTGKQAFEIADTSISYPVLILPASDKLITLKFKPQQAGPQSGHLHILSNDPYQENIVVELTGTGLAPRIILSTMQMDFGRIPLTTDSTNVLIIYNSGSADLIIYQSSLNTTGGDSSYFTADLINNDSLITAGDSATLAIHFNPEATGPSQTTLQINSNDPLQPKILVLLSGLAYDNMQATITFDSIHSTNPLINGQPATLSFNISSSSPVDSSILYFRAGGKSTYMRVPLANTDANNWSGGIITTHITERGLEYYVRAYHGWTMTQSPEAGGNEPEAISVHVPQLQFPDKTKTEIYQMISIPLSTPGQDLNSLFADDLGTYDDSQYRFFDCLNGSTYVELTDMTGILPPGKALWLITREAADLNISDAQSVLTNRAFSIQLRKGWNMISTPFDFPVNWNEVNDSLVLRFYDGTSDWPPESVLEPFKGYAVHAPSDMMISIPPHENQQDTSDIQNNFFPLDNGWQFQIIAETGHLKDRFNYAGVLKQASTGLDKYDLEEPPPIADYIRIYFQLENVSTQFSSDYRAPGQNGYRFHFTLASNVVGEKILKIRPENLPASYNWAVISDEAKINFGKTDIKTPSKYSCYELIVGSPDFIDKNLTDYAELPSTFKLEQNYPNPFNPTTFIKYQIPQSVHITIKIFNILGQRVKTLVQDEFQDPGYYQLEWNGSNDAGQPLASGIYFLRLSTSQYNHSVKMLFQK